MFLFLSMFGMIDNCCHDNNNNSTGDDYDDKQQ